MARPASTAVEDWPIERLAEHTDWSDPLADFPPPEAQGAMLMEMVKSTLEKRDRGESLDRMGRTLMVGTNNSADRIPTYSFFTDGPANSTVIRVGRSSATRSCTRRSSGAGPRSSGSRPWARASTP